MGTHQSEKKNRKIEKESKNNRTATSQVEKSNIEMIANSQNQKSKII